MTPETLEKFTFWSKTTITKTNGKRSFEVSGLKQYLTSVRPGEDGWFSSQVIAPRDRARKLYKLVKSVCPDLVVDAPEVPASGVAVAA